MSNTLTRLVPLALLVGLYNPPPSLSAAPAGPCAPDVKKLCADVQPGGGRIAKCLKDHEAELSDACRAKVAKAGAHQGACGADVQKFCKDVQPGGGSIGKCLKQHDADLSAECKAARAGHQQKHVPGAAGTPKAVQKE